jgi:hypothetical protein
LYGVAELLLFNHAFGCFGLSIKEATATLDWFSEWMELLEIDKENSPSLLERHRMQSINFESEMWSLEARNL